MRRRRSLLLILFVGYISFLIRPTAIFLYPFFFVAIMLSIDRKGRINWFKKYYWVGIVGLVCAIGMMSRLSVHGFPLLSKPVVGMLETGIANSFYYPFISVYQNGT
jgi:hypothetical protein